MSRLAVWFTAPGEVEVREEPAPPPGPGEVAVATLVSAISPGTEMLVYRGLLPEGFALDANLPALAGDTAYPLRYGYAAVGRVDALGPGVDPRWHGRRVFAFQPHASRFVAVPEDLVEVPEDVPDETAALLPTMETAVSLLMDGRPIVGERVVVFGQGVVGLAATALLGAMPLTALVTLDRHPLRRELSLALGATESLDPADEGTPRRLDELLEDAGADLVYELSGNPAALDAALDRAGFAGRVVVGSWYGREPVALRLGGRFHRERLCMVSSQVSTVGPEHAARWTKRRRLAVALRELRRLPAERWVTHRFPLVEAAAAYDLLARCPGEAIQVVFTHSSSPPHEV